MNPYSLALGKKNVAAAQNLEGWKRQLARRFKVSPASVQKLSQLLTPIFKLYVSSITLATA